MSMDSDLIRRVNAMVVALEPVAAECRAFGHHTVFGFEWLNEELARVFVQNLRERAGEVAVHVRWLEEVASDVPDGLEVDVVKRRSTTSPKLVDMMRAAERLLIGRSDCVAVSRVVVENEDVVVATARPATVFTRAEKCDAAASRVAEPFEEELNVPVVQ